MSEDFPQEAINRAAHNVVDGQSSESQPLPEAAPSPHLEDLDLPTTLAEASETDPYPLSRAIDLRYGDSLVKLCSYGVELTPQEVDSIKRTLDRAVALTKGKIIERVRLIACGPSAAFRDSAPTGKPGHKITGGAQANKRRLLLNIDDLRTNYPDFAEINQRWFDSSVSQLEFVLAHELAHPIDFNTQQDLINNGHSGNKDDIPGQTDEDRMNVLAAFNWPVPLPSVEPPPTKRARANPREDFAESFAIICLGGRTEGLKYRLDRILKTIQNAQGSEQPVFEAKVQEQELLR